MANFFNMFFFVFAFLSVLLIVKIVYILNIIVSLKRKKLPLQNNLILLREDRLAILPWYTNSKQNVKHMNNHMRWISLFCLYVQPSALK